MGDMPFALYGPDMYQVPSMPCSSASWHAILVNSSLRAVARQYHMYGSGKVMMGIACVAFPVWRYHFCGNSGFTRLTVASATCFKDRILWSLAWTTRGMVIHANDLHYQDGRCCMLPVCLHFTHELVYVLRPGSLLL